MEQLVRLSVLAGGAAISALVLRRHSPELSMLITVIGCVLSATLLVQLAEPLYAFLEKLFALTGMRDELFAPLLKCVGIGLLAQLSSALCVDAGETALSRLVELCGSLLCFLAATPLLEEVLHMIRGLIV